MKKILQYLFHRFAIVVVLMLVQLLLIGVMVLRFRAYFTCFYALSTAISIGLVIRIVSNKSNPAYQIAWIIVILLFPVFGGLFYLLFGIHLSSRKEAKRMEAITDRISQSCPNKQTALATLQAENRIAARQAGYIEKNGLCPLWQNTEADYLSSGEETFHAMLTALKQAEHYIFLEYFIIEEGKMWNSILEILEEKVKQGVEVRIIYDDMGCMMRLPYRYDRRLKEKGIKALVFNPFIPVLNSGFNNRDHRKICIIDGWIGFNGGVNLADEYINVYKKHGHWKDTAVLLKGDAVWNLTTMFLSMWEYLQGTNEDYEKYHPRIFQKEKAFSDGYLQPYMDNPLDDEPTGENVYLNLIYNAEDYIYITTPYLIIDHEMLMALSVAAKSGIDVRIITPHIADKRYVHTVTRGYYPTLIESGVRIYEYTPGFVHAKTFVVDDRYGVVGSINLDYRSLYLHFECGTWMYRTKAVAQMKHDFLDTLTHSCLMTAEACRRVKWYQKVLRSILRIFAPLM